MRLSEADSHALAGANAAPSYLHDGTTVMSWLNTRDHKRVGVMFLVSVILFFFLGGIFALLLRFKLLQPGPFFVDALGYNRLFTLHGIVMIFLFLIPSIPSAFGNFVLPLMLGARDVAFPRLNLFSFYLYLAGAILAIWAMVQGGADTGWTFYTPYSSTTATQVLPVLLGVFILGFSSILTGLNFIVTVHTLRAPGLNWMRLPLFVWAIYATSVIQVLATPVLGITVLVVAVERVGGFGLFDPARGGDPVLFQHMFWFYSHPAVYIMILPGMGVVSELITTFAHKRTFGYTYIALSSVAIAVLGFLVWGHHLFVAGESMYASMVFSLLSYLVAVPSGVKVFNWTATLHKGSVEFRTPMVYALGFIGLFTMGGLTGLFLAALGLDIHVHDTYFVVAHFHYIMVGGMVMAYLGGIHYWWPKISGRMYPENWGRISAVIIFLGFNLTFFPQFVLGYLGMPRRYWSYPDEFQVLNVLSTAGASILGAGYLLPMSYLLWSLRYGAPAPANPWGATGLEWQVPSPPSRDNFEHTPVVTGPPYDYPGPEERLG